MNNVQRPRLSKIRSVVDIVWHASLKDKRMRPKYCEFCTCAGSGLVRHNRCPSPPGVGSKSTGDHDDRYRPVQEPDPNSVCSPKLRAQIASLESRNRDSCNQQWRGIARRQVNSLIFPVGGCDANGHPGDRPRTDAKQRLTLKPGVPPLVSMHTQLLENAMPSQHA